MASGTGWMARLVEPNALSVSTWVLAGIPSILGSLVVLSENGYDLAGSLLISVGSWLALGAVWLLARRMPESAYSIRDESVKVLVAFFLGAVVRSTIFAVAVDAPGIVLIGTLNTVFLSVLFGLVVGSAKRHHAAMSRLKAVRRALKAASAQVQGEIVALRESTKEAVLSALERSLLDAHDSREVAVRLKRVTQDVVRPMSHDLARQDSAVITMTPRKSRGVQWMSLARATFDARPCHPVLTTSLYLVAIIPPMSVYYRTEQLVIAAASVGITLLAVLLVGNRLPWKRMPMWLGAVLLPITLMVAGAAAYLAMTSMSTPEAELFSSGVFATSVLVLFGVGVALFVGLDRQQPLIQESLIEANTELAKTVSAANAQLRRERHQMAQVLHGVVQPRLVARAVEESDPEGSVDIDVLLSDVTTLLTTAVDESPPANLRETLSDLQVVWGASADIHVRLTEEVDRIASQDPSTGRAVCKVACEAVHNAVLRGSASRVEVEAVVKDGRITLCVTNPSNGVPLGDTASGTGLGMELYDSMTDSWELYQGTGKVVFIAQFTAMQRSTQNENVR